MTWFDERVRAPARNLLAELDVGERALDLDHVELAVGIEELFRLEASVQYPGWPRGSTTDGRAVDVCLRPSERVVEVAGRLDIDFDGRQFPFRAVVTVAPDGTVDVDAFIGDVDADTGQPPRLPRDVLVLPTGEGTDLAVGRRQTRVTWTKAFSVHESP